jgi:hypothetical protein
MNFSSVIVLGGLGLIGLVILAAFTVRKRVSRGKRETDYHVLFDTGIVFLFLYFIGGLTGLYEVSSVFNILGLVSLITGLANRINWKNE